MKKWAVVLLAGILILATPIVLWADLIIEPLDDSFWYAHSTECVYEGRFYTVNAPGGALEGRAEPGSETVVSRYRNGAEVWIWYTYSLDGDLWGLIEYSRGSFWETDVPLETDGGSSCWVPMSQLELVYDGISFYEEHQAEFYPYTGTMDALRELNEHTMIPTWDYPGYRRHFGTNDIWENAIRDFGMQIDYVYRDPQGREWGWFEGDWYGEGWICLSDPLNTDLVVSYNPATGGPPQSAPRSPSLPFLSIGLVAGVVLLSGILIRIFWRGETNN